ncbi:hypothetical protein ACFQJD_09350 [Haloplanus sp. GCM10025708]
MARRDDADQQSEELPVDVEEYHDEYVITLDMPGVDKQDIDVRA